MPLTIDEYSYVIVDNGAAYPGELAIGRVHKVDDELVGDHWHALKDTSAPTPAGAVATCVDAFKAHGRDGRLPDEAQAFMARTNRV